MDRHPASELFDAAKVIRALRLLISQDAAYEIRCLDATASGDRMTGTISGYFNDHSQAVGALQEVASAKGIYLTLNPVNPALLARSANHLRRAKSGDTTSDKDIDRRTWLLVDLDYERPSGISTTDDELNQSRSRALEIAGYLSELGWPEPVTAASGNGFHLLFRVDLPADDGGLVERVLKAMAGRYNTPHVKVDTSVHNPARICKLYGTIAAKGDDVPDRPHRMSEIVSVPESLQVVPLELLESLAAEATTTPPATTSSRSSSNGQSGFDLVAFIERHSLNVSTPKEWNGSGRIWTLNESPLCSHGGDGPYIAQQPSGAIVAGCHHESCKWTWRELRVRLEPDRLKYQSATPPATNTKPRIEIPSATVVRVSAVRPIPIEWLWPGRIALGKLTVFSGDPGLGKSFLSLDLAARVSTGCVWPDDTSTHAPLGSVVLLSGEDDLADTIRPRLDAAAADCEQIDFLKSIHGTDQDGTYDRLFDLARDIERLEAVVMARPDCRLVVIDPVSCYLGRTKSHDNAEVRGLLAPLAAMASRTRVAVLAVSHLRKADGPALHRTMGSLAFVAAARACFAVVKDKDDPTGRRRLWLPLKNNIGNDESGLAFELSGQHGSQGQPCVLWHEGAVTVKADDAMATPHGPRGRPADELNEAIEFLKTELAGGPRPARELIADAQDGYVISKRTLDRARHELGIVAYRETVPGPWIWRLSDNIANSPKGKHSGNVGNLAKTPGNIDVSDPKKPKVARIPMSGNLGENPPDWELSV